MSDDLIPQVIEIIGRAQHPLIVSHPKPDGDTIGAALAIAHYCEQLDKPFSFFCVDRPAAYWQFLPKAHMIGPHEEIWVGGIIDLIIVVDASDLSYAGIEQHIAKITKSITVINIDHHVTNTHFGEINLVDSAAAATCEIVYRLLDHVRAIDRNIATCLLTGIITDTGSFSNLATTASAVAIASQLLAKGADLSQIARQALSFRPYNTLKLWGRALERLHQDPHTGMIVTAITLDDIHECDADPDAISGISNFLNSLEDVSQRAVLVLTQSEPGIIHGSLRTTNPLLDVSEFAKLYGGGGHKKAAGFSIQGILEMNDKGYVIKSTTSNAPDTNRR